MKTTINNDSSTNNTENNNTHHSKIFHKKHGRKFTMTYHNLNYNVDVSQIIQHNKDLIQLNIYNDNKQYKIKQLYMSKEPYSDTNKNHLVHIHALIVFENNIRINKHQYLAKLLKIKINEQSYYPHISLLRNEFAYKDYIVKLQKENNKYCSKEWYDYWLDNKADLEIEQRLEYLSANTEQLNRSDILKLISSYKLDHILKYRKKIDFLFAKLPVQNEHKIMHHLTIDYKNCQYLDKDYNHIPRYQKLKREINQYVSGINKKSLVCIGKKDSYKTSMIKAATLNYQDHHQKQNIIILRVTDLESLRCLNKVDQNQYDRIILIIDDYDFDKELSRSQILQILEGNDNPSILPARYENVLLSCNVKKIFVHNTSFYKLIKNIKEEIKCRINEININNI